MRNNIIYNIINLFRLLQEHLLNPSKAMSAGKLEENFGGEGVNVRFIIPISVVLVLASVISSVLWSEEFTLSATVYSAIVTALSPVLAYYVIKTASIKLLELFGIEEDADKKVQMMTLQLMLLYFIVEFLSRILPGANLLVCIYIYAFYMIWFMSGELLRMAEHQRMKFMLAEMLVCAVTVILISVAFLAITPKHPEL